MKSTSVVARAAINSSLNVWMARSATLTWWLCGLTSCSLHLFSDRYYLMCLVAWLSITLSFSLNPFDVSSSEYFLHASNMVLSSIPFIGVARMQFDL